jgi:hypothetical protein
VIVAAADAREPSFKQRGLATTNVMPSMTSGTRGGHRDPEQCLARMTAAGLARGRGGELDLSA